MAPRCMSERVKLLSTLTVLLMFVSLATCWMQSTSKKRERDGYVIRNVGIKLCQLKCAEHGQCLSIEYDIETLTCRLSKDESKIKKKKGHIISARSHPHVPTGSCRSGMCIFGQRCLKTRSGREVCVQASTDPSPKKVPSALVTTQDLQETPSPTDRDLYFASRYGELETVKRILAVGHVDINTRGGRWRSTPVMVAAEWGHKDVVEFLVDRGADVSLVDSNGNNVLHWSCKGGLLQTVKLILSLGVLDINAKNSFGETVADLARVRRRQQIVAVLVARGAQ